MTFLNRKSIVLGVGGGIAAYRSLELIRLIKKEGARVCVMPTANALHFVGELSFAALSGEDCLTDSLSVVGGKISHIEEAYRADAIVVAPATCDLIAKMANGFADSLILQTLLSFRGPCLIAPAMESQMWEHEATKKNVKTLTERGCVFIGPNSGGLASGRNGIGRMAEPAEILEFLMSALTPKDFAGQRVLVTAGPTVEDIDPVRFISNRSSGKMGVAIARALAHRGANVHLVHGPISAEVPTLPNLQATPVRSADEMYRQTMGIVDGCNIAILCAAVSDFAPTEAAPQKVKKSGADLSIQLRRTPDILASIGALEKRPFLVGFAAETQDLEKETLRKCFEKNCDVICGNIVATEDSAFGSSTNQVVIFDRSQTRTELARAHKNDIAMQIADIIKQAKGL